jgi:hypothetical protein
MNPCKGEFLDDSEEIRVEHGYDDEDEEDQEDEYDDIEARNDDEDVVGEEADEEHFQGTNSKDGNKASSDGERGRSQEETWYKKTITLRFSGSLVQLSNKGKSVGTGAGGGSSRPSVGNLVSLNQAAIPEMFGCADSSCNATTGDGRVSKKNVSAKNGTKTTPEKKQMYMIKKITLKGKVSSFPCSLGMNIEGIPGIKPTESTHEGECCNHIILPRETEQNVNEVLWDAPLNSAYSYIKEYPDYIENLWKGIIKYNETTYLVPINHPAAAIITSQNKSDPDMFKDSLAVESRTLNEIISLIQENFNGNLPVSDLKNFGVLFFRVFTSGKENSGTASVANNWLCENEIYDTINKNEVNMKGVREKNNSVFVKLEIQYKRV